MNIDINKNPVSIHTGIKNAKVKWTVSKGIVRNNPDETTSNWDEVLIWEGTTHTPNIRFEMFAVREQLYCIQTYNIVTWGPNEEYMLELNDYMYVDTPRDGYKMVEDIYKAIMKGTR